MNLPNSSTPSSAEMTSPSNRILATVLEDRHGYGGKDDCITVIRCNGTLFYVDLSPIFICNSPVTLARYLEFMSCVRDDYPWDDDDDEDDPTKIHKHPEDILQSFHTWLITALQPLFLRLAPSLPPSFDPSKLATGDAHPLISEYLFPAQEYCRLEVDHETPLPLHLPDEEDTWTVTPLNPIDPALAADLRAAHIPFLDASSIEVSFHKPSHALDRDPTRVLAPLDPAGPKTTCFLKTFGVGGWDPLEAELAAHLRILKSTLPPSARVIRLLGVVTTTTITTTSGISTDDEIAGILLTYIPGHPKSDGGHLSEFTLPNTPMAVRAQWAAQITENVAQLHEAGLVWGDAQAGHVMIDAAGNAWLIGMGGRNVEGLVDADVAGTVEGDLQGVGRILGLLGEVGYEPFDLDEREGGWEPEALV